MERTSWVTFQIRIVQQCAGSLICRSSFSEREEYLLEIRLVIAMGTVLLLLCAKDNQNMHLDYPNGVLQAQRIVDRLYYCPLVKQHERLLQNELDSRQRTIWELGERDAQKLVDRLDEWYRPAPATDRLGKLAGERRFKYIKSCVVEHLATKLHLPGVREAAQSIQLELSSLLETAIKHQTQQECRSHARTVIRELPLRYKYVDFDPYRVRDGQRSLNAADIEAAVRRWGSDSVNALLRPGEVSKLIEGQSVDY
jgi:hypothetical protein